MSKNGASFYAVSSGVVPGIYTTWEECKKNVDGFSGAKYKSFKTKGAADLYILQESKITANKQQSRLSYWLSDDNDNDSELNKLSETQRKAFDIYKSGSNMFITGPGGTGKSLLIKMIAKDAADRKLNYNICATTGIAAVGLNCGAKTIHSWAGIGLGGGDPMQIVNNINASKFKRNNWKKTQILVVDEVSMMSKNLFELLNFIGQRIRKNDEPFGGIQVIFSGDFYQLPPVEKDVESVFCFQSPEWNICFPHQIEFTEIFRQSDEKYKKILNQIRRGRITKSSIEALQSRVGIKPDADTICTKILPTRNAVDKINREKLMALDSESVYFDVKRTPISELELSKKNTELADRFHNEQKTIEFKRLTSIMMGDDRIELKIGAYVMCTANLDMESERPICNGSQGIILKFREQDNVPIVKFNNGVIKPIGCHIWRSDTIPDVAVSQIPLILSWAITVHKSQGLTLDAGEIDAGNGIFECGQTYVALSRICSLNGLYLTSFNHNKIKINPIVTQYYLSII